MPRLLLLCVVLLLVSVSPPLAGGTDHRPADTNTQSVTATTFKHDKPSSRVLLQLLFRHGDRSAIHVFSWDEHESAWPQGTGQLTKLGMEQSYRYGGELRHRYADFLPSKYDRFAVEVKSTDYDRTLMTVQCLLVGLFPASNGTWPLSPWQPIPIHTQAESNDQLFAHAPCPKLDHLDKQSELSKSATRFKTKYQPLYDQLTKYTGTQVNKSVAHQISDTMFCEAQHNMSRPSWMTDGIFQELMNLRNETYTQTWNVPGAVRLAGGAMLAEMTRNMENRAKNSSAKEKLFLFSAHDTNVANLGKALGIFNDLQPPYLTSITLELHQQDDNYFVKTLFDNHTQDSPYVKTIKGCAEMCPLAQFHELLKDNMVLPEDRAKACAIDSASHFWKQNGLSILSGVLVVLVVAVSVMAYKLKRMRSQHKDHANVQYRQLLQDNADNEEDDDQVDDL